MKRACVIAGNIFSQLNVGDLLRKLKTAGFLFGFDMRLADVKKLTTRIQIIHGPIGTNQAFDEV